MTRTPTGFTLLETLLVLTLLGLLAAMAYPSYARYLTAGKRQIVEAALLEQLMQQEQYRHQHNRYAVFAAGEPGDMPFRADAGQGSARYLLGARPCAGATDASASHDCIEAFALPAFPDAVHGELIADSQGRHNFSTSSTGNP